ncbi:MAG TPA: hypothetical protein VNF75_05780 [Candidatus Dormibacteraeota bacterium]|nr:hypothetical protein [Candidatus Dormibacteraeota bacterium]
MDHHTWFQRYICRLQPWPQGLEECFAGQRSEIYLTMVGPSDCDVTGSLKKWEILGRLHEISVPSLFVAGRHDECTPEHMRLMRQQFPLAELALIESSAIMPFYAEPGAIMTTMQDFRSHAERAG